MYEILLEPQHEKTCFLHYDIFFWPGNSNINKSHVEKGLTI